MKRQKTLEESLLGREKFREQRKAKAKNRLERLLSNTQGVDGATSMLVTLRYLMDGGDWFSGLHGGAIEPFFRKLYQDDRFCKWYVTVPHEQLAGHAAEGFAASTGKVGVAVVTSGPGVMNLATACYDAWMDSASAVFIAANVSQSVSGSMAFQEAPVTSVFKDISKKVFYVTDTGALPSTLFEAFNLARSGRPGPVVVDIPKDVLLQKATFTIDGLELKVKDSKIDTASLTKLSELIASAERPLLYIGGGVKSADASTELARLVETTGIPVAYTLKGKGAFPDSHPRCIGPLGMHGLPAANFAVKDSDLLVVVGARFDDRVVTTVEKFAPKAYIAHLDIDPRGIGPKRHKRTPQLVVEGDVKDSLRALNELVTTTSDLESWYAQIEAWQRLYPFWYQQKGNHHKPDFAIKPQLVLHYLNEMLKEDSRNVIYVTDVGQHQMWAMQWLETDNPRGFLTSGGSGTMGYGLPAALGAKLANPGKRVLLISGDLSFRMTAQTLELYRSLGADITAIVLDNHSKDVVPGGMVQQWLELSIDKTTRLMGTDKPPIASIANGYGVAALEITRPDAVKPSLEQALSRRGPQVLVFKVDPKEKVFPMIPPGKSVDEMIYKPLSEAQSAFLPQPY